MRGIQKLYLLIIFIGLLHESVPVNSTNAYLACSDFTVGDC